MSPSKPQQQGCEIYNASVLPEWIDINNHMNVAYYVLAFDQAVDKLWDHFGITEAYIREQQSSTFAVESHVCYLGEMNLGDPYVVTAQVLAYDEKRIHQFQRMYHAKHGYLAATCEWMNLHVDMNQRRVSPWPEALLEGISKFVEKQGDWGMPADGGRQMRIRKPVFGVEKYQDMDKI
jgi:acyl-CoA thioester hydrolase